MTCLVVLGCAFGVWVIGHVVFTAMDSHVTQGHYERCWRCRLFLPPEGQR